MQSYLKIKRKIRSVSYNIIWKIYNLIVIFSYLNDSSDLIFRLDISSFSSYYLDIMIKKKEEKKKVNSSLY